MDIVAARVSLSDKSIVKIMQGLRDAVSEVDLAGCGCGCGCTADDDPDQHAGMVTTVAAIAVDTVAVAVNAVAAVNMAVTFGVASTSPDGSNA